MNLLPIWETVLRAYELAFGQWHPLIGMVILFMIVNFGWELPRRNKGFKKAGRAMSGKIALYVTYLLIAHQLDRLAMNGILDMEGGTAFFLLLYLLKEELRQLLGAIRKAGYKIPGIFEARMKFLEDEVDKSGQPSSQTIEDKIKRLKESIEVLKELRSKEQGNPAEKSESPKEDRE